MRRQTSPKTTNETLARRLVRPEPGDRLKLYSGPGAYNIMLNDLLAQVIDGVLMDRPYAMLKVEQIKGDQQGEFSMLNITSEILPGLEPGVRIFVCWEKSMTSSTNSRRSNAS